ncbi:MAG: hypothetical protein LBM60_00160 [Clostridium sp.]|nr:hypothetical protein [Clostridium sp.]
MTHEELFLMAYRQRNRMHEKLNANPYNRKMERTAFKVLKSLLGTDANPQAVIKTCMRLPQMKIVMDEGVETKRDAYFMGVRVASLHLLMSSLMKRCDEGKWLEVKYFGRLSPRELITYVELCERFYFVGDGFGELTTSMPEVTRSSP